MRGRVRPARGSGGAPCAGQQGDPDGLLRQRRHPGEAVITGHQVATFVNPANGKSIVENTSSSGHFDYGHDPFVLTGRSGVFSMIMNGRLDLSDMTLNGTVRDEICPAIA